MLHSALDRAVKEKLLLHNPAEDCVVPKLQRQEMRTLKPEDMRAYLEAAEKRGVLPMFYLELVSGIRKGELVALRWEDLDVEHRTISVSKQALGGLGKELVVNRPKTENSIRAISIPQDAVDLLVQAHEKHPENPYLFPSPLTGGMYHPDSVVNLHKKILKDAGPGAHQIPRSAAYLCHHGLAERRRCENGVQYAGPLRCRIHPPHLHPCHPADAATGGGEDGEFYETGPVTPNKNTGQEGLLPARHSCIR